MYYSFRTKFKTAFRRFKKFVAFNISDSKMSVYYYSPGQLKKIFAPRFIVEKKLPVGLFIPPSYLENKITARRLEKLSDRENKFGYSFLSGFADHYCNILKRSVHQ